MEQMASPKKATGEFMTVTTPHRRGHWQSWEPLNIFGPVWHLLWVGGGG